MAYEVRGSMIVFLVLVITASFTPYMRTAVFLFLTAYSVYADTDVLANIPFFTGALLADLSLIADNTPVLPVWNLECCGRRVGGIKVHWPILVFLIGLFLGSYPPNSHEMRWWSEALFQIGESLFPSDCMRFP